MKIKEVEQKTKLSAKAIRLYEEKGLIDIQRDDNDYREYTQKDIDILLKIKLFRKCGLSIQEIQNVFSDNEILNDVLYDKISELDKSLLDINDKKELCLDVIKANGEYTKIYEYIDTIESEEFLSLMNELEEPPKSLAIQLFQTIMLIAPLLWFLLYYDMEKYDQLIPVFFVSIFTTIIMTLSWKKFLKEYKFNKETIIQGLGHTMRIVLLGILFVMAILFVLIGITGIQYILYMKNDVYMFSQSWFSFLFSLIILASLFEVILGLYGKFFGFKAYDGYIDLYEWIKKHMLLCIGLFVFSLYLSLSSVTTVSPDKIVHHSFINPFGTVYSYDDIKQVECGFLGNSFFSFREKGDFYYKVTMSDGKTLNFNNTQTNEQYEEDTYSELVVFDNEIMKRNVIKISSEDNSEFALLDQIYIDRFKSIINNK